MPTIYLYPAGPGNRTELTPRPVGPNWACVDEDPATLLDYVEVETEGILLQTDYYTLTTPPADPGALSAFTLTAEYFADKIADAGAASIAPASFLGITALVGGAEDVPASGGQTFEFVLSSRPGGGSWSWADLSTLQIGQRLGAAGGGEGSDEFTKVGCFRTRLKVVYTVEVVPPAKGIVDTAVIGDGTIETLNVVPGVDRLTISDGNTETL